MTDKPEDLKPIPGNEIEIVGKASTIVHQLLDAHSKTLAYLVSIDMRLKALEAKFNEWVPKSTSGGE